MRNKRRKSLPGPARPGSVGAGMGSRCPAPEDGERRPAVGGESESGSSWAARITVPLGLTGWRARAARLALAVIVPVVLLVLAEGILRLFGSGYPATFCLRQDGTYIENDRFLWQFYSRKTNLRPNPFAVAVAKPVDGLRSEERHVGKECRSRRSP